MIIKNIKLPKKYKNYIQIGKGVTTKIYQNRLDGHILYLTSNLFLEGIAQWGKDVVGLPQLEYIETLYNYNQDIKIYKTQFLNTLPYNSLYNNEYLFNIQKKLRKLNKEFGGTRKIFEFQESFKNLLPEMENTIDTLVSIVTNYKSENRIVIDSSLRNYSYIDNQLILRDIFHCWDYTR